MVDIEHALRADEECADSTLGPLDWWATFVCQARVVVSRLASRQTESGNCRLCLEHMLLVVAAGRCGNAGASAMVEIGDSGM